MTAVFAARTNRKSRAAVRSPAVGRDHRARRVQELPNPYKFVRLSCLPLRGKLLRIFQKPLDKSECLC